MDMEAMDMEAMNNHRSHDENGSRHGHMSKGLRRTLVVTNCLLLCLGDTGGPLLTRLYFRQGGHRQWLSSWLETGGWSLLLIPLYISYSHRRRTDPSAKLCFITPRIFAACVVLGLLTGADDLLYAYAFAFLPVSTAAILTSTHLVFTALFAFLIVRQRFTAYSINAVALLTVGALLLGLHGGTDRPKGVTKGEYLMGFFLILGAAALYGLVLPLVELTYVKAKQRVTYTLVMEMQLVMNFFSTVFCTIGMAINNDFEAIPTEAKKFGLGEVRYYVVLVWSAIFWQFFFLGAAGVIFCVHTLLAGIIIAVCIPVIGVLGVIFFHEDFSGEKGVALGLSLWGLASYSYGEYRDNKDREKQKQVAGAGAGVVKDGEAPASGVDGS